MTIDYYYDIDSGERVGTSDSIWNFHVWNEAYFDRPDLPEGNIHAAVIIPVLWNIILWAFAIDKIALNVVEQ